MTSIITEETHNNTAEYTSSSATLTLPEHDTDVTLKLPNGNTITLQWRTEFQTLDVLLPKDDTIVTNWNNNTDPAPPHKYFKDGHVRFCKQLCIECQ